ncbi:MAG: BLUF domain-containing protein [Bacteroidia bacterium]
MFELVYRSKAIDEIKEQDIVNILAISRKFNAENEITGCLIFFNNRFIQILEGNKNKIQELYTKIQKDKRHSNVQLLSQGDKVKRIFIGWSMAFYKFESEKSLTITKQLFIKNLITFSETRIQSSEGSTLFWKNVKTLLKKM